MSREILFKAKRTNDKGWVKGYYAKIYGNGDSEPNFMIFSVDEEKRECQPYSINPDTLCQYTGLNDGTKWEELSEKEKTEFLSEWNTEKGRRNAEEDWNGRKIFEGDIVSVSHSRIKEGEDEQDFMPEYEEYNRNYAVEFVNKGGHCGYRCRNKSIHFTLTSNTVYNHNIKVVGNIFDNPELLNQ